MQSHRHVYVSTVLPGMSCTIRERHRREKEQGAALEPAKAEFFRILGVTGWNCWLQHLPQGDFHVHCLEGEALPQILSRLRRLISEDHPLALELHDYYKKVLGKDYGDRRSEPQAELLVDLTIDESGPIECVAGYCLPLLSGKTAAHRRATLELDLEAIMGALRPLGYGRFTKWLQRTPAGDFLTYYTELTIPFGRQRALMGEAAHCPKLSVGLANLKRDTGIEIENLHPDLEFLTAGQPHALSGAGAGKLFERQGC
jgi:hypothetical protein